ncbi:MAG: hypothetical protein A2623_09075 [Caulobacterales bacterium RIFCSPHIGHO2_01_FULL_70_19]|nr:MAG: hypothetical protein A2623_09075 [Caulobacterales bacterium RIFCSPHIGHO2_01_FULL_70_19]
MWQAFAMIPSALSVILALTGSSQEAAPPPPAHPLDEVVVEAPPAEEGQVVLNCRVGPDGRMENCRVESEQPPGRGFAEAALRGARDARIRQPAGAGGRVTFTVRFRLDD